MSIGAPGARLLGRSSERDTLDRLLEQARAGRSGVLVLHGEPGIGKTALLDHLRSRAAGVQVLRAAGVESEMELAFAGLHQLTAPLLSRLDRVPPAQRDALLVAFGLASGQAPDRFLVAVAALTLLSETAADRPVLCLIDDAQWLDRASAQTLGFVARRLVAEHVAMVFAERGPDHDAELAGLPRLVVEGLGVHDARALLDAAMPGPLDERVRERIVAESHGNPLALLELPRGLTPAELAGGFGLAGALPVSGRLERGFARRLELLPAATRRLLVTAAAEPIGDVALLGRAVERLGLGQEAVAAARDAGLIELGARVRFRHPLIRSAAYRTASPAERRQVHRALADATDPERDPDHRAWHLACAALGPDEPTASELERSAERARARGGVAAAAAFLERATHLTPVPERRAARALDAARAKFDAAAPDAALELLTVAEQSPLDALQRARLERLRAQIAFTRSRGGDAPSLLLDAARRLEPLDAALARETYLEAVRAEIFAGRLASLGAANAATAAVSAPQAPPPPRAIDLLLDGLVTRFTDGYADSVAPLRRALAAFRAESATAAEAPWLWLACPLAPEPIAPDVWDDATWRVLAERAVRLAREYGALTVLPIALTYRAVVHVHAGELAAASELIEESHAIAGATGSTPLAYSALVLTAWRGEDDALQLIDADIRAALSRGEGRAIGAAEYAAAVLHNGCGRYGAAVEAAQRACEYEDLGFFGWALGELVEAAARSGQDELAAATLGRLAARTRAGGTDWALGVEARARALLEEGRAAEALYREAIERLGRTEVRVELARARLLYGEWLRREQRRVDAREQLRAAHELFAGFGAEGFAARARRELQATGETLRPRTAANRDALTPQEAQIARLAAEGQTNPEIGAQLFISPRTVEYHLRKVFAKLGIGSRRELRDTLPESVAELLTV